MKQVNFKIFFLIFLKIINVSVGADAQKRNTIFAGVKEDPIKNYVSMFREQGGESRVVSLNAEDTSKFRTKREITEEILLDFGFSVQRPISLKETSKTPIKGMTLCCSFHIFLNNGIHSPGSKNILSIFLLNPEHVSEITNAKVVQNETIVEDKPLMKNDESSYSSDPFDVPSGEFEIFIEGWDSSKNPIFREFTIDDGVEEIFEYGFSLEVPSNKNEVSDQSIKGKLHD
jgi:hypothetical protein